MFLKFKNQIFNLNNYKSIIDVDEIEINTYFIYLDNDIKLSFSSKDIRNDILNIIWVNIKKETKYFDLDEHLLKLILSKKFKLI